MTSPVGEVIFRTCPDQVSNSVRLPSASTKAARSLVESFSNFTVRFSEEVDWATVIAVSVTLIVAVFASAVPRVPTTLESTPLV